MASRKHATEAIKYFQNSESVVYSWINDITKGFYCKDPTFGPALNFITILPNVRDLWEAYLTGRLEIQKMWYRGTYFDDWTLIKPSNVPSNIPFFGYNPNSDFSKDKYRIRPEQPKIEVSLTINGEQVSPAQISAETWANLRPKSS